MGVSEPEGDGRCMGHQTEGSDSVEVGQTQMMFKASFLHVHRWPGWDVIVQIASGAISHELWTVSNKGHDDIAYNIGDTRNFDIEYDKGHIHEVVALECWTFSVTAACKECTSGNELAGILQACKPNSTLGVHWHDRLTSRSQTERQRGRIGKIASKEILLHHRYNFMVMVILFWAVRVRTGSLLSASYSRIDGL